MTIPARFDWVPGQHCFLRFRYFGIHALTSHPFTICSLPGTLEDGGSELTFYIRHGKGLTAKLHDLAQEKPGCTIPVYVDGPYGGVDDRNLDDSDRLLVIAGGSGAGWILPFIEQYIQSHLLARTKKQPQTKSEETIISSDDDI